MRKLCMILSVLLISILTVVPAFAQLAYQIDVGQDGTFETGDSINLNVSESVTMDIYVSGYACSPGPPINGLFGTLKYILLDESKVSVSGFPFDTNNGGPWEVDFSGFYQAETNVYNLSTAKFTFVTVVGGIQKLGTMTLTGISGGTFILRVANDLSSFGYPTYSDGYIANCNLANEYPTDATLTINPGQPTVFPEVLTECPVVATSCPVAATTCPAIATECPVVATTCPAAATSCPAVATECPVAATSCPVAATSCPAVATVCPEYRLIACIEG